MISRSGFLPEAFERTHSVPRTGGPLIRVWRLTCPLHFLDALIHRAANNARLKEETLSRQDSVIVSERRRSVGDASRAAEERSKAMPGKKHLRGVSEKEQRQYEHIKESAEESGRYGGRAKEVAARTVLKQHKKRGHGKGK